MDPCLISSQQNFRELVQRDLNQKSILSLALIDDDSVHIAPPISF